jgi:hypothetical protein
LAHRFGSEWAESGDGKEGSVWSTRNRGRSRRGILTLSGKHAVPSVLPFKGSKSGTPAVAETREDHRKDEVTVEREPVSTLASSHYGEPEVLYQSLSE